MNIFVVEDERWALAELEQMMLAKYGTRHRIHAFDNGDDALTAAGRQRPSLVLTDINMPGIDGLELIEELAKLDSSIKCIILSVHDEFEYARQSMRFGVGEYLLKPVKKEALFQAIDHALVHIEEERRRRSEWFAGSLAQMLLSEEVRLERAEIEREVNRSVYGMVLLSIGSKDTPPIWRQVDQEIHSLEQQLQYVGDPERTVVSVDLDARHRLLLLPMLPAEESLLRSALSHLFDRLKRLPAHLQMAFAVKKEKEPVRSLFLQMKQCIEEQAVFGMSAYLIPGMKRQEADLLKVWDKVRAMDVHYRKGDLLKGHQVLDCIIEELTQKRVTRHQLKLFVQDMLFSLHYRLAASSGGLVSWTDWQEDLRSLNGCSSYAELTQWLQEKLVDLYCGHESQDENPKGLVPMLLQHIHQHYQNNISLQQFACDHHISLGYLSRMFKSQTGTTFSEYITGYRIRKAKELLSGGVDRLQEVSQLVGYEDTKHFSALFKKYVGQTPMAYAREHSAIRKNSPL
ncbi:response regulator [Paenibacillus sp. OAS669]|uniref:response regulator n=1 Tax=Paenibacillus sp. OAS669 TaxID=2663821 RepID=UPI00178B0E99|nr:response regulator [Paenibacillus sp. OAS669]MBE1442520.1 YesN/AraC family two-component response regulator [Paenibacillus sp. OAS669]